MSFWSIIVQQYRWVNNVYDFDGSFLVSQTCQTANESRANYAVQYVSLSSHVNFCLPWANNKLLVWIWYKFNRKKFRGLEEYNRLKVKQLIIWWWWNLHFSKVIAVFVSINENYKLSMFNASFDNYLVKLLQTIGLNGGRNQYPEKNHRAVMSNCMPCCIKHISRVKPTNLWGWLMTFRHTMWYKVMALWEEKKAWSFYISMNTKMYCACQKSSHNPTTSLNDYKLNF